MFPTVSSDIIAETLLETKLLLYWMMVRETTDVTVAGECALRAGRHKRQADYRERLRKEWVLS